MVWFDWFKPAERIRLEERDFAVLVAGGTVQKGATKIVLADIGWYRMLEHIGTAMRGQKEEHGLSK